MIRVERLDSGVRLVTEHMPGVHSVAMGIWVGTGSRDESDALAGASHFLEHLLFKGTESRSASAIAESLDAVGGDSNAFTTKEYTAFYIRLLSEHGALATDLLCDIMTNPALRPDEFEAERQVILDEILMHADEPGDEAAELCNTLLFPDPSALGRDTLGTARSISDMDAPTVRSFFDTHYRAENLVVAVAGAVNHDELRDTLEATFLPARGNRPTPVREVPAPTSGFAVHSRDTEQAHLMIALRSVDRFDPSRYAVALYNHVLGGGLSSRLFRKVREERGLAYSIWSERTAYDDTGALAVVAGTAPEHALEVCEIVAGEITTLGRSGVTARELEIAKGNLRAELLLSSEDSGARMARLGTACLFHDRVAPLEEVISRIAAVTSEEVAAVAASVSAAPKVLAAVGPFDRATLEPAVAVLTAS